MQPRQTRLISTRFLKKTNKQKREDPTRLDLSVLIRRVRERVQGECVAWIRQKKGQFYHSSEWRIADLLPRHHISTHTQADGDGSGQKIRGQRSSSDPVGAVKLSDMPEGIEVVAAVALLLLHSHPLCILVCWPPTTLHGDWVARLRLLLSKTQSDFISNGNFTLFKTRERFCLYSLL